MPSTHPSCTAKRKFELTNKKGCNLTVQPSLGKTMHNATKPNYELFALEILVI